MVKNTKYVKINSGQFKDMVGKIRYVDTMSSTYMYYIQLSDQTFVKSIKFYFSYHKDAVSDDDFPDITLDMEAALLIRPQLGPVVIADPIISDSSSSSSSSDDSEGETSESESTSENESHASRGSDHDDNNNEGVEANPNDTTNPNEGEIVLEHPDYGSIKWKPVTNISGEIDTNIYSGRTTFNWNEVSERDIVEKNIFDYFILMFPMGELNNIVLHTSNNLQSEKRSRPNDSSLGDTSRGELMKYFGIRLLIALLRTHESIDTYWSLALEGDTVLQGGNFNEKYGMSRNRFQNIEKSLAFGPSNEVLYSTYIYII